MPQKIKPQANQLYGTPQGLSAAPINPIKVMRAPTAQDTGYNIGQLWVWPGAGEWILNQVAGGLATWNPTGGGTGVVSTVNTLPPTAGNITIAGTAAQIAVANAGSTVTLSIPAVASNTTSFTSGSFITSTAATSTTLSSNTLSATGTNAAININLTPKGTGSVIQTRALVGNDVTIESNNTDNTNAASNAVFVAAVGGTAGGDPKTTYIIPGGQSFATGIHNATGLFCICDGTNVGTTNVMTSTTTGSINFPLTPSFLVYLATTTGGVTGNGTAYTLGTDALTKLYDQQTNVTTAGVFTAPVTGRYDFRACVNVNNATVATKYQLDIVTSSKTYTYPYTQAAGAVAQSVNNSVIAPMTAGDTAHVVITVSGEAGATDAITGSANPLTYFCGTLVA